MTLAGIYIVDAAVRLPGVLDLGGLERHLLSGKTAYCDVPEGRRASILGDLKVDRKDPAWRASYFDQLEDLDRSFRIPPVEKREMDPQQQLLLYMARQIWERRGNRFPTRTVGCFVGQTGDDHRRRRLQADEQMTPWTSVGVSRGSASSRISHAFDLHGPSMTVDSACSSGLLALHTARRHILAGDCDAAFVGAANLILGSGATVGLHASGALSPLGESKPFTVSADGYGRGEGAVLLLLVREDLLAELGSPPIARILGSAAVQDGHTDGIMRPSPEAQAAGIRLALAEASIGVDEVAYVEAHGTGTRAGDAAEVEAIAIAYAPGRRAPLPIGSVKASFGHLEAAAGLLGLAKALLVCESGRVPPTVMQGPVSDAVDWASAGCFIVDKPLDLDQPHIRVGVSSAGFGGTNVHVILEGCRPKGYRTAADRPSGQADTSVARADDGERSSGVAWVFSGHGGFYPGIGTSLAESSETFLEVLGLAEGRCQEILGRGLEVGCSTYDLVNSQLLTLVTQLTAIRLAYHSKTMPGCVIGHSFGEFAASVAAGEMSELDAIELVCRRLRRIQERARPGGAMALVTTAADVLRPYLETSENVEIAVFTSPHSCVVEARRPR